MIHINGQLRSHIELRFVAGLYPCLDCGGRDISKMETFRTGGRLVAIAWCLDCQSTRKFRFTMRDNPSLITQSRNELGGSAPSSVIRPVQFVEEFDRVSKNVVWEPEGLDPAGWRANLRALDQAATCLVELFKFIPEGGDAVPFGALDNAGRAEALARSERYRRDWIVAELDRYRELFDRHERDGARIYALEAPIPAPRGELSSQSLRDHREWKLRDCTGDGRLNIANVNVSGRKLGASDMSGALLDGVIFDRADVSYSNFDNAELIGVRLEQANLDSCAFIGARLVRCDFLGAIFRLGKLDDAVVEGGRFDRAHLNRCLWRRARVNGASFRDADFANSTFDDAVFIECDLRGANLALRANILGTTTRTRFERCDLRDTQWEGRDLDGAEFVDCKFYGASGRPARIAGVRIERPDLSPAGDGLVIGSGEDVFDLWCGARKESGND